MSRSPTGRATSQRTTENANAHGYHQSKLVPGLWKHIWRPIHSPWWMILYAGDLTSTTSPHGATGALFTLPTGKGLHRYHPGLGLRQTPSHLSMHGHAKRLSANSSTPHHRLKTCTLPPCPSNMEPGTYAKAPSTAKPSYPKGKKFIQQVCGKFLFLGRCGIPHSVPYQLPSPQSSKPTVGGTLKQTKQLFDYIATQDGAVLTYNASDMVGSSTATPVISANSCYAAERRRTFFLSSNAEIPHNNGAALNIAHIIKHVVGLCHQAELAALLHHGTRQSSSVLSLEELWPHTTCHPAQTDNSTAEGAGQWKDPTQTDQSHGHAIPLARDRNAKNSSRSTGFRKTQYGDY
eukprot:CCRYP_008411-RA/>CCRYP_008411-RA protein AED:0.36 eAED:0.42 QI:0/0/0/1/0.5/0.33/3/0/347